MYHNRIRGPKPWPCEKMWANPYGWYTVVQGKWVYVKRQESPDQRRLINTKGLRLPPEYNGMSLKDLQ